MPASSNSIGSLEISALSLSQINDRLRRIGTALSGESSGQAASWIAWTPAVSAAAPMTATSVASISAAYIQIGPVVHFRCRFTVTLGGTMGALITITGVPVAALSGLTIMVLANVNGQTQSIVAYIAGGAITVANSVAFTAGANTFTINGTYQCA